MSPHKGFRCAYHAHTGRQSCSHLGLRAVRRYGALSGLAVLRQRLYLCGVAHRRFSVPHRRPPLGQRGDCDIIPCDCDLPSARTCSFAGDVLSNCGSCDWPERKRKDQEREVYLPPKNKQGTR
ncbi:MAG: membrane protein insertion efficiency factor YidD [Nitrosomonadales bacterium]|nr:membrane protein insertion efficiency factor YidD [Nitrosomonadales bacterium]